MLSHPDKLVLEGNCLEHFCLKTISHFFSREDTDSSVQDVQTGQERIYVTLDLSNLDLNNLGEDDAFGKHVNRGWQLTEWRGGGPTRLFLTTIEQ